MKTTFNLLAVTAIFGFAIPSSAAQAGTITSKSFTGDADSGISSTKNYVLAVDLGGTGGALTINGVSFADNSAPLGNTIAARTAATHTRSSFRDFNLFSRIIRTTMLLGTSTRWPRHFTTAATAALQTRPSPSVD